MSSDTCPSFQCIGLWLLPFSRVFICQNCRHHLFQRAESTQCWFKESILLQLSRGLQMLGISLGRKKPLPSSAFLLSVKAEGCWMRPRTHHRQWVLSLLAGRVVPGSSESLIYEEMGFKIVWNSIPAGMSRPSSVPKRLICLPLCKIKHICPKEKSLLT